MRSSIPVAVAVLVVISSFTILAITAPVTTEAKQSSADGGGYRYTDGLDPEPKIKPQYMSIKNHKDAIGLDTYNYDALILVDIGFTFKYYGQSYSRIYISTYGAMSFVDSVPGHFSSSYCYNAKIPSTSYPVGVIAPYWTPWDNCYTNQKDRLYVLQTDLDGEKVFVVEWNTQNGGQFEALLYEGGMIKFQYQSTQSWYNVGSYCVIGIESPDETTGTPYINFQYSNSNAFNLPFAITFTKEDMVIRDVAMMNGDGRLGDTVYAESKEYIFRTEVQHSANPESILSVFIELGSLGNQEHILLAYYHKNETFEQKTGINFVQLNADTSSVQSNGLILIVDFHVDFLIGYPSESPRNVTAKVVGRSAIPVQMDGGELYWVETEVEWNENDLVVKKITGDVSYLENNDFIGAGETVQFLGVQIFYESSDVQPPPDLISIDITDNYGIKKTARINQGKTLDISWDMVTESVKMIWDFHVYGIPPTKMLSEDFTFNLMVDSEPPAEVTGLTFHPDSENDPPSKYDNDQAVYVRWDESTDGGSGIGGYIVEASLGPYKYQKKVGPEMRYTYIGNERDKELPEGIVSVSVWAMDNVGNLEGSTPSTITIDLTGPTYELISPGPDEWALTNNPQVKVRVTDELSGVDSDTLFYRYSKDGGMTYSEWERASGQKTNIVNVTLNTKLAEGTDNKVEVKASDIAGSEETRSIEFPIKVDSRSPSITMTEPDMDKNGTTIDWIKDWNEQLRLILHDWMGSGIDPDRMSYRYSFDNGSVFSADIPLEGEPYNSTQGYSEYSFVISSKSWAEGDQNLLEVTAYDLVGKMTKETFRIRMDITPTIQLLRPIPGMDYFDNKTIKFLVLVEDLDGDEDVTVYWSSNIDGPFGSGTSLETYLSEGEHLISVTVDDGVHTVKRTFTLLVKSYITLDPAYMDSDRDGMNDSYEKNHGLDPLTKDSDLDLDKDGHTNIEEMYAGTDPNDKDSYPGSTLKEDAFPFLPLILLILALLVFLVMGFLAVRESRRQVPAPFYPPPPMQLGYIQQYQQFHPGQAPAALPPYNSK